MAKVISEARKALREAALAKRQNRTEFEMVKYIQQKHYRLKSEKDLWLKLPDGQEGRVVSPSGYQKFVYNPDRLYALAGVREFFFPGYGARLFEKRCLTPIELNVALGLPMSKVKQWIIAKEFPPPLGLCYTSYKGEPIPAYTVREALTYMKLLADEVGQTEQIDYWTICKREISPILFAAHEQFKKIVFEDGNREWRLKD
jgi:hypothetical protein